MALNYIELIKWVIQHIKRIRMRGKVDAMFNKQKFPNPKKLILVALNMVMNCIEVLK